MSYNNKDKKLMFKWFFSVLLIILFVVCLIYYLDEYVISISECIFEKVNVIIESEIKLNVYLVLGDLFVYIFCLFMDIFY